jgi:hypothetical protein
MMAMKTALALLSLAAAGMFAQGRGGQSPQGPQLARDRTSRSEIAGSFPAFA